MIISSGSFGLGHSQESPKGSESWEYSLKGWTFTQIVVFIWFLDSEADNLRISKL